MSRSVTGAAGGFIDGWAGVAGDVNGCVAGSVGVSGTGAGVVGSAIGAFGREEGVGSVAGIVDLLDDGGGHVQLTINPTSDANVACDPNVNMRMHATLLHASTRAHFPRRAYGCRHRVRTSLLLVLLAVFAWLSVSDATAGDRRRVWKTIETEHFIIHYYEPLLEVAKKVARVAERSHMMLVPVFEHAPEKRTHITLLDQTDSSNGFASVLPYNRITLFATAPSSDSVLNDHDDWLFFLTAHEYTHILHLDTIDGLPKWINKIVGKSWAPNQVQPRWVIEGLATYEESKHTSGGRTRSSIFNMNLRSVVLTDEHLDLAQISNGPRLWPRGTAAYLYGSHFLQYIFDRYGDDKVKELTWAYGTNPIPYSLNRTIRGIVGKTFDELYAEWREHLKSKYSLQVQAAERIGLREGRQLTFTREFNFRPRYTRDGTAIVWSHSDGYVPSHFRIMPVGDNYGDSKKYTRIPRSNHHDMLEGGGVLTSVRVTHRTNYSYDDLFRWDPKTEQVERLTHGLRAKEPAASPDGSHVAFVITGESQSKLALMPLQPHAQHRILWKGDRFDQVSTPRWSPDGRSVVISSWSKGGYRDIRIVDVETGEDEPLTHDRAIDIFPVYSPDGAYVYFVSDRSGIYNVYAIELSTREIKQVTNVLGGTFAPDVSPDGNRLVYFGFGVGGYDLYEVDLDPSTWTTPPPYINDRPDPTVIPHDVAMTEPKPYRPLATLAPRTYALSLATGSFGTALTVNTSGSDVVGLHNYQLGATIDLGRADVNLGGSYLYSNVWGNLRMAGSRSVSSRSGVFLDNRNTRYVQETYSFTAGVSLPLLRSLLGASSLGFDYDFDWIRNLDDDHDAPDPNDTVPRFPELDYILSGVALRWSYGDAERPIHLVGAGTGKSLSASVRLDHPALGSDYRSLSLGYAAQLYKTLPWMVSGTLSFRLAGAIATTNRSRQSTYALGGVADQDIATSLRNNQRAGSSAYLRGFERRFVTGPQYHLANFEYRQLLYNIERGRSTLPFYIKRIHLAGLLDVGHAFAGRLDLQDLNVGMGGALRLELGIGYFAGGTLDVGYAHGLTAGGLGESWLLFTGTF